MFLKELVVWHEQGANIEVLFHPCLRLPSHTTDRTAVVATHFALGAETAVQMEVEVVGEAASVDHR